MRQTPEEALLPVAHESRIDRARRRRRENRRHRGPLLKDTSCIVAITSPSCGDMSLNSWQENGGVKVQDCVAVSDDNHIRFKIHGLNKAYVSTRSSLEIGWLYIDNEHIRIDDKHIPDLRKHVKWRSASANMAVLTADNTGASNDVTSIVSRYVLNAIPSETKGIVKFIGSTARTKFLRNDDIAS